MKTKLMIAALALLVTGGAAFAETTDADRDTTPVTRCEGLPAERLL